MTKTKTKRTSRERIVRAHRGHDCIKFECAWDSPACAPGGGGSHGRGGVRLIFAVKGSRGAVAFTLYTGWTPRACTVSEIGYRGVETWGGVGPFPSDLGFHSKAPMYEGQGVVNDACDLCDGQACYYDGSSLNANDAMYALVNGGDEALWAFLEAYYGTVFDGAPYPAPAEYSKPLRGSGESEAA